MPIYNINNPSTAKSQFSKCIGKNKVICLYFWKQCGHCVEFAPIWEKVTNIYKDKINVINIELDCMRKLDNKYQINGFPTIIVYGKGNKLLEYNRTRTEKDLVLFIQANLLDTKPKAPVKKTTTKKLIL